MTTICIDCRYIGQRPSGIAEVVQGLVDFVPLLAPDLEFLLLKNPSATNPLSTARNVREVVVPQAANGAASMWWLPHVVDLSAVDLFHATFNIMPAGLKMPCVTTLHDVMWLTHPQWCNPGAFGHLERRFYRHGIQRALHRSAAIATVSRASRDEIVALEPEVDGRTFVTLSGVSDEFRPVAPDPGLLHRLGIPPTRRFVLTVGQYAPYKNHEGALRAFALAFPGDADVDLVLVQRMGRRTGRLLRLVKDLGLDGRVHIPGAVRRAEMVQLYSMAGALLHPSLCEGFGNPLAEAMACGCPVVTSNISAMPEVTDGAAVLVPPDDPAEIAAALRRVMGDRRLAETMRAQGLARAAQLSWRSFAVENLKIYRDVLARRD